MPLYEFDCHRCGTFTGWRAMSASSSPASCPACGQESARVLSATAGHGTRNARRKGVPPPRLVARRDEPPRASSAGPEPPRGHPPAGRPWMIGH